MNAAPVIVTLNGEPKGKGRPRFVKQTGRAFTPAATRSYEAALRYAGQEAMAGREPIEGAVSVIILARFPVPVSWPKKRQTAALDGSVWPTVKPDADNLAKMLDAFNEVVWRDDKQAVAVLIMKSYGAIPGLSITVTPI
jgi:Holliday junction resolvase RusA-like endonuclease